MASVDVLKKHSLVYLATPYSKYPLGIEQAFRDAANIAGLLLKEGVKAYSPITHTHPIAIYTDLDPYDHSIWLPFDAEMMKRCEALVVAKMEGWDKSYGINHEVEVFDRDWKPVYFLDPATFEVSYPVYVQG